MPDQNPGACLRENDAISIIGQSCLIGILIQGLKYEHFDAHSVYCYYSQWKNWMNYLTVGFMLLFYKTVNIFCIVNSFIQQMLRKFVSQSELRETQGMFLYLKLMCDMCGNTYVMSLQRTEV